MLYLVATPIGNLKEITHYAIEILNSVDYILCEDTRTSLVLLNHYNIKKPLQPYHKFNEKSEVGKIINDLKTGKNVALISDAGMPGISDPGNILVNECIKNNVQYTVISGPSALINAFVMSGMPTPFTFIGFLPDKNSDAKKLLEEYKKYKSSLIFYVAPHDLKDKLKLLHSTLGDRNVVAVREISKKFEEKVFFNLKDEYAETIKGEFVLVVEGNHETLQSTLSITEEVNQLIASGMDKNSAIKQVAHSRNLKKNDVYQEFLTSNNLKK